MIRKEVEKLKLEIITKFEALQFEELNDDCKEVIDALKIRMDDPVVPTISDMIGNNPRWNY